ncbi:cell-surface protein [Neisseria flavescens]|jgi:cell-surface protein|uniref:IgG-binding virulence factor TspB family protein n=1 Tax=Neisseria flavescens TaxID=484 RepID=UPI0007A81965|nr:IgG-binding virulence factor TspB family protein [Neisseria flavescens]KZC79286.1 cell-surface protein [Neisseria flavescens]
MSGLSNAQNFQVSSKVVLETEYKSDLERRLFSKINLNTYGTSTTTSARVIESTTGASSTARIGATLEAQVSRKAVLSGAFGLVKKGAALGTRLSGWGTAAYFAYQAYETVKPSLEAEGYKWDESKEEFFKYWAARNCITIEENGKNIDVTCFGVDSSVLRAMEKGGKSELDAKKLMESQMQSIANGFWKKRAKELDLDDGEDVYFWQKFQVQKCYFDLNGGGCDVSFKGDVRSPIHFRLKQNDKELLDLEKFLKIATPSIDANPTPFVEGTGKPEYKENIKVPAGTVVTIGPFTPENGKPVQVTITFGQDSNGNTTAEVATTQRPDLTPGGSEAPNTKPDPDPNPNPDGKPDKKPDDKPDSDDKPDKRPDDKPDPDDDPSDKDKDKRKEDKKDDKKEESKGLLCDFFPDILACDKMGKPEEGMFDDIKIPQVTDENTWDSDNFLPPNGVCPQPKSFNIWGRPVQISYEPLCVFMEKVRFAVLLGFIIMSAFIVFGSLRK